MGEPYLDPFRPPSTPAPGPPSAPKGNQDTRYAQREFEQERSATRAMAAQRTKRGMAALAGLIKSLEEGHTPADTLYRLAGLEAPNAKTKERAKSFDELMDESVAAKQKAAKGVVSAQVKAKAAAAKARRLQTRDTGVFRPSGSSRAYAIGGIAGYGNELARQLAEQYNAQRAYHRRRDATIQRPSRAAATRVFQPSAAGLTNRTGAASTRPLSAVPSRAANANSVSRSRGDQKVVQQQKQQQATAQKQIARQTTSQRQTTQQKSKQGQSSWEKLLNLQTDSLLSRLLQKPRTSAMQRASRSPVRVSSTSSTSSRVASLEQVLQLQTSAAASSPDRKCKCPGENKKQKKSGCVNPIVSRVQKDGFITIKRKIQCQPSKTNSP